MPQCHSSFVIAAPLAETWRRVYDIERYPDLMETVRSVTILRDDGDERHCAWSILLKGSVLEWTEREHVLPEQHRIQFTQMDGDLDQFEGYWQLVELEPGRTEVELMVKFEIGIPLLADMLNPVAVRALEDNSERMLRALELPGGGAPAVAPAEGR